MLEPGTTVSSYRIERVLGRGGMGTVFLARHVASGRRVALKILRDDREGDPEFSVRLAREGRAQASLEHPNVVTVYDAGESDHGVFLAMQLIDGPRLIDEIRERRLDVRRAMIVLAQVADALDAAHDAGLVHRDVKPHNVLVGPGDHAYLSDFGLTRAARVDNPDRDGRARRHGRVPRTRGRSRRRGDGGLGPLRVRGDDVRVPDRDRRVRARHRGRRAVRARRRSAAPRERPVAPAWDRPSTTCWSRRSPRTRRRGRRPRAR